MAKNNYQEGFLDGMLLACVIAREDGLEALEDDVKKRNRTGICPGGRFRDLDNQVDSITRWVMKRVFLISVASIHDAYGFGRVRLQRFFDCFSEATRLLMKGVHGGTLWTDIAGELADVYGIELTANSEGVIVKELAREKPGGKGKRK